MNESNPFLEAVSCLDDEKAFVSVIEKFNRQHQNSNVFADRYGKSEKLTFMTKIFEKLDSNASVAVKAQILKALRLCCREQSEAGPIGSKAGIDKLIVLSGLESDASDVALEVQAEAAKCLVNVVLRTDGETSLLEYFHKERGGIEKAMKKLGDASTPSELHWPYGKLLYRVTGESQISEWLLSPSTLSLLADRLDEGLKQVENEQVRTNTMDIMRTLVNITMPLGPLNAEIREPTEAQFEVYKRLVDIFQRYLFLPREACFDEIRAQTVTCLINVPARCTPLFEPERTLEGLLYVLSVQIHVKGDPSEALVSVLLVLTSIARAIPRARGIIRQFIFPPSVFTEGGTTADGVNPPKEIQESDCIAKALLPYMCSFETALRHYTSEFFFILVDEDPNELVRLTGFGNAAGLLAMKKLFDPKAHGMVLPSSDDAPVVENIEHRSYDPGNEIPENAPQEVLDLIDRMEQRGLLDDANSAEPADTSSPSNTSSSSSSSK